MSFVRKQLDLQIESRQFLSPAVQTVAIQKLSKYMSNYYRIGYGTADKPTCVHCFDMSGSGKTATIMEAARNSKSLFAHISLIDHKLFRPLLDSCKKMGERQNPPLNSEDFISCSTVKGYFQMRFQTVLTQLFQSIIENLNNLGPSNLNLDSSTIQTTLPAYISPTNAEFPFLDSKSLSATYDELVQKMQTLKHLLVIHLDDCQEFFCGLTKNFEPTYDGKIKVDEIMGLALRMFSKEVCGLGKCKEILWVFSGTRPNMYLEMKIASKFGEPYDVSETLNDFNADNITTILGHYFSIEDISPASTIGKKIQNLTGPPKLLYWFIFSAMVKNPESLTVFENQWDEIENNAVGLYKDQIIGTIDSFELKYAQLDIHYRNLVLLYTSMFINNPDGVLYFNRIPTNWVPLIEAGLIRMRKKGTSWRIFQPNRFLVKIFSEKINWFNWENIQDLVANIKASETTKTLKGKVFEYLFALELLAPPDSALWKRLEKEMNIRQKLDWNPKIQPIGNLLSPMDQNVVYIMIDPARDKSKADIVFFAESTESSKPVRVLCQLTAQMQDSTEKAKNSFLAMLEFMDENIPDYRLFLSPNSTVNLPPTHKHQFSSANCFWLDSTTFGPTLKFSLDLCDPSKSAEAIAELKNFALSFYDKELADKIGMFLPGTSKKRKREFESMEGFYGALKEYGLNEKQKDTVEAVLESQEIFVKQLSTLTDAELEKYGLIQGGLRKAVLAVIENY